MNPISKAKCILVGMWVCAMLFGACCIMIEKRGSTARAQETPQQYVIRTASAVRTRTPTEVPFAMTALSSPVRINGTNFGMLAIGRSDDPRWAYSALARMDAGIQKGDRVTIVELVYVRYHSYDYDVAHLSDPQLEEHIFLAEPAKKK